MSKSSTDAEVRAVHSSMSTIEEMGDLFSYLNDSNASTRQYQGSLSAKLDVAYYRVPCTSLQR